MKKRCITSLVAGGLMAAMLPGAAMAQTEGEVALTYALNPQCEFGQGSAMPPCEIDESGPVITITASNPQSLSGAFDGIAVLNANWVGDQGAGTFEATGTAFFAGEVEGCGAGTVNFDYTSAGTINEDGSNTFDHDTYTIVPGGTLAVTGGYTQTGEETPNGDGTATIPYTATYACDETPATEGEADADADEAADDAEEQADEKEDELEDKADEKEEELKDAD